MRRVGRVYDPSWVIENDEFHPDPRQAALHADLNALKFSADWLGRRVKQLKNKKQPLDLNDAAELRLRKDELAHVTKQIEERKEANGTAE